MIVLVFITGPVVIYEILDHAWKNVVPIPVPIDGPT